ncbi:PDR/VanB family oxidoreductase [Paenarthrobacter sp. NPDC058040]|uniref:PDR/VanB family oxidoreductase n=1 Tax=unclassified Paenarthrobacter TaxID=2634190 RepID=UPI0036DD6BF3
MSTLTHDHRPQEVQDAGQIEVRVIASRREAESVTSFELRRPDEGPLPAWAPGAHIDVHLPSGTIRQYSLCGDPGNTTSYRIAVLELPQGRGGSVEVHRELRPGRTITIGAPRDNFSLTEAEHYVFVAGGIGITPLLPMIHEVHRRGVPWKLVYGARSLEHFAFLTELASLDPESVELHSQDTNGHPDLGAIVEASHGALVYTCGPSGLMDALTEHMERAGRLHELRLERFAPAAPAAPAAAEETSGAFDLELKRSGLTVGVQADQTVLEAVRAAGVNHPSSCEMGFCGTCEVKVLCGTIDHRDDLLTEDERSQGDMMMICVSRSKSPTLVLDI